MENCKTLQHFMKVKIHFFKKCGQVVCTYETLRIKNSGKATVKQIGGAFQHFFP